MDTKSPIKRAFEENQYIHVIINLFNNYHVTVLKP